MASPTRRKVMLAVLAAVVLVAGLGWHLRQRNEEVRRQYLGLAWLVRRGDADGGLTRSQRAFLQGNFLEALRRLEKPLSRRDEAAENLYLQCLLRDLPWPRQVLRTFRLEHEESPDLLFRVVQSGYARDSGQVTLDVFSWDGRDWQPARLAGRDPQGNSSPLPTEWAEIRDIREVHLERKDEKASQVLLIGKTRTGKVRAEVFYGLKQWRRWVTEASEPPQLQADRLRSGNGRVYKLVDDEWVEVGR